MAVLIRLVYVPLLVTMLILIAIPSVLPPLTVLASPPTQEPTPIPTFEEAQTNANTLLHKGDMLLSRSEFKSALESYQGALSIYRAIRDQAGEVYTLIRIGSVYERLGEYHKALEYYQESWPEGESRTLDGIAAVYIGLGDYQKALQYSQEALSISKATGDAGDEADALINIGVIYTQLGEYTSALKYFQEALEISQEIDHRVLEATALNDMGGTYGGMGEYQRALDYLLQALSIRREINERVGEVNTLNSIAFIYGRLGDYQRTFEYLAQAIDVGRTIDYQLGEAQALNSFGMILGDLGEHRKSVVVFQQALAIVRDMDNPHGEVATLTNIGFNYYRLGDYAKALENYEQALSICRDVGSRAGEATVLTCIGGIYDDLGNPSKAIEYHQQALSIFMRIGDVANEANVLFNIGYTYEKRGDYQRAFDHYAEAIDAIERVRSQLTVEELRMTLAEGGASVVYEHTILTLLKLNMTAEAFNYAERAKARTFLDLLGNQRVNPRGSEDSQLIEQERQLGAEITALNRQLHHEWTKSTSERTPQTVENLSAKLETKRQEYEDLLIQLQLANPEYAALVSVDPLTLEDAQALLQEQAPDVTLVAYFVGEEGTIIFVVGSEAFHAQVVSVTRRELRQQGEALLAEMNAQPMLPHYWQVPAQALHEWLIAPIQDYLPPANPDAPPRLGITPHDLLHYLPFDLLYDGKSTLLEGYTLFYAPSVSGLRFIFEKRHPQEDTLLAFAKPDAPAAPHLHHALEEVQAIATLYETQALIGTEATEGRFKVQAGKYGLVHVAAHSDLNVRRPLFCAILLQADETEDGRLETHEIFNLDLPQTGLVVLSACETHLGELSAGDELVGLERAFVRAGSPSLLTTLWPVDDAATAELMKRFYTYLRAGIPKAEALRLAQLETRAEHPEPYYWSGFVLVGDAGLPSKATPTLPSTFAKNMATSQLTPSETTPTPQPTPTEGKRSRGLYVGAAVLLLAAIGIIIWRRRLLGG